jgi:hypothetical protein
MLLWHENSFLLYEKMHLSGFGFVMGKYALALPRFREGPVVSQAKVGYGAANNGHEVGDQQRQMRLMDEQPHQGQVAQHRNQAVGEMEAHELAEPCGSVALAGPGVVHVPKKVVKQGEFDGRG